ncbi:MULTISPECIES: hypothetical protein [Pseudomonas]|uniref:hypothetical protein n=1 Tax=Pseudomonas TaxID=286 RepID=UPI0011AF9EA1|nr:MULTISPECIES: hypothetical protein [Pseudomonas]QIA05017.1 hypothetical protein GZH78_23595 [Pseudomonas fluorescens]
MSAANSSPVTPVVDVPQDGSKTGLFVRFEGTGTPGNSVRVYSTKDSLNPLFSQVVSPLGSWLNHQDFSSLSFYAVEVSPDGKDISPPSPIVNISLT